MRFQANDFSLAATTLIFQPNETQREVVLTVNSDSENEGPESLQVSLNNPIQSSIGSTGSQNLVIVDQTAVPVANFLAVTSTVNENDGQVDVSVILTAPSNQAINIPINVSGTASNGSDFQLPSNSITFPANTTSQAFRINILADQVSETDETIILSFGSPSGGNAEIGSLAQHTVNITEGSAPPSIEWSQASIQVSESNQSVTITAELNRASVSAVTVGYGVIGGTADSSDHNLANGVFTFSPGSTSESVTFQMTDDSLFEGNENMLVTLISPANANLGSQVTLDITIQDNESAPTIQFANASRTIGESFETRTVAVELSAALPNSVTVPFTISGTATINDDVVFLSGSPLTIPPGQTSADITFLAADEGVFEGNETVILELGTPTEATLGSITQHTTTITDGSTTSSPTLAFSSASQTVVENGSVVSVVATLSSPCAFPVSAQVQVSGTATANNDFSAIGSSIDFPVSSTQQIISFTVADDSLHENNETVIINLSNQTSQVTLGSSTHTVTINDNDAAPVGQWAVNEATLLESSGTSSVQLQLNAASGIPAVFNYTVSGTASSTTDYTLNNGTVTVPAGSTTANLNISLTNDSTPEPDDESIVITLASATDASVGSQSIVNLTIDDDDLFSEPGIEAFRNNVYPISRANCVSCHGATQVPLHAFNDIQTAYDAARSRANFTTPADSILVIKTTDGHCGSACLTNGSAMTAAVTAWAQVENANGGGVP